MGQQPLPSRPLINIFGLPARQSQAEKLIIPYLVEQYDAVRAKEVTWLYDASLSRLVCRNYDNYQNVVLEIGVLSGRHRDGSLRRPDDFGVKPWSRSSQGFLKTPCFTGATIGGRHWVRSVSQLS